MRNCEPRILKCPGLGLIIEFRRDRVWAHVIARKASAVFTKRVRIAELDLCADDFEYPRGIAEAARRFRHPDTGVATVTPEAITVLEEIMRTYAINPNTALVLGRFEDAAAATAVLGENPEVLVVSSEEDIHEHLSIKQMAEVLTHATGKEVSRVRDKAVGAKKVAEALEEMQFAPPPVPQRRQSDKSAPAPKTPREFRRYRIKPGADFSERKGGFRETLNAVASGCQTVPEIYQYVCAVRPGYKKEDIYSDLTMARKYGYLQEG